MQRIIITPTFRPHFPFNRDFLQSYAEHAADAAQFPVHFITARDELADMQAIMAEFPSLDLHVHAFEDLLAASGYEENTPQLLREVGKFAFQSLKKLYALKALEYDQALLLDSEALILKPIRVAELFDEYYADPFVLYSDLSHRGDHWFGGQSDAVVKNAAKLLRLPYPNLWFLEYYGWFYEKRIILDLFASLPEDLLPAVRTRLKSDTRLFENQLIYHFIWANAERYGYRFASVQDMLQEYLGPEGYAAYMRHFEGDWQQTGLFEMVSKTVTERNVAALTRLFNDKRYRFYRFELLNRNDVVQRELIERTPIAVLVSSEGYRRTRERIAICLSGMPRNPRQNLRFIRSFLAESDVDVFFHFWEGEDEDYIVSVLQPKAHVFEPQSAAPAPPEYQRTEKLIPPRRIPDVTSMFYSIKRANDLKRAYEEEHGFRYDVVVRLRLDFFSTRPLVDIIEDIRYHQIGWDRTLYVPDMAHSSGINDQIALGSSDTMDQYCSLFDQLQDFAKNDYFNAEYMLLRNVLRNGLRIRTFPFEYILLRNDVLQTFDIADHVERTQDTWWSAQLPPIPRDTLDAFFAAKADSVALVDELGLEFPKVFRLRAPGGGYLRYVPAARTVDVAPDAAASTLFYLIVAGDDDRTAINIRPRELVLAMGATRQSRATSCNFYPDADGRVRPDGAADEDSAFFLARRGDTFQFEWRPGFWKTPADPRHVELRSPGGGRPSPPPMPSRPRLALQVSRGALTLEPLTASTEGFAIERVPDAAAESVEMGLDPNAPDRVRASTDPLVLRLLYLSYLTARTFNQRGAGAAKEAVSAFIRKRAHRAEQTNARGLLSVVTRRLAKRL